MIEIIIMVGVIWNALLQTYWFYWSRKVHNEKHYTDHEPVESEVIVKCKDIRDYIATPKSKDEVFSGEKKYDPNKIQGAFDSFFEDK